jgi:acyl carrier protein
VAEEHEVQVYAVALIRQGTIAKTSSGKIQRNATRRAFVAEKLEVEFEWREAFTTAQVAAAEVKTIVAAGDGESPEVWLRSKLASVLRVPIAEIDVSQPITRYGLDSLMVVELSHSIEEKFGVAIPLAELFESVTIVELCERLRVNPVSATAHRADESPPQTDHAASSWARSRACCAGTSKCRKPSSWRGITKVKRSGW